MRNLQQLALKISELWLVDSIPAQFFSKSIHQFKPPLFFTHLPSGTLTYSYGKSPLFIAKSSQSLGQRIFLGGAWAFQWRDPN
jgi:hypothetical protein